MSMSCLLHLVVQAAVPRIVVERVPFFSRDRPLDFTGEADVAHAQVEFDIPDERKTAFTAAFTHDRLLDEEGRPRRASGFASVQATSASFLAVFRARIFLSPIPPNQEL